jgi:hypothetical protein
MYSNQQGWQKHVTPQPGKCWIPAKHFDRLRHRLNEIPGEFTKSRVADCENVVLLVFRRHWLKLVSLTILPGTAAIASFWLATLFWGRAPAGYDLPYAEGATQVIHVPGWIIPVSYLILGICSSFVTWVCSWQWSYKYRMVTNKQFVLVTAPPAWLLPLMSFDYRVLDMGSIIERNFKFKRFIGSSLNVGDFGGDSPANTGDVPYNELGFTPRPAEVYKALTTAHSMASKAA